VKPHLVHFYTYFHAAASATKKGNKNNRFCVLFFTISCHFLSRFVSLWQKIKIHEQQKTPFAIMRFQQLLLRPLHISTVVTKTMPCV
jgi:hypothetical protein